MASVDDRCASPACPFEVKIAHLEQENNYREREMRQLNSVLESINCKLDALPILFEKKFVSKSEFEPIRKFFWATLTLVIFAVIGALIALVLK